MLIRSVSGIRGYVNSHFTPEISINYARALNEMLPEGVIMAGRDSRPSGEFIMIEMINEFNRLGRTVINCNIVPTPTIQFMVKNTEAVGGFIVTASHNPIEWNGLKFVRSDSTFFHPSECERLFKIVDSNKDYGSSVEKGLHWPENNAIQKHIISCVGLKTINLNRIRKKKFRIVVDAVNGAGSVALPQLLESLGCDVIPLYCEPNGEFIRGTEPIPTNLVDLCNAVKKYKADAGFAIDPDADRLAVVDEKGIPLGEEYTLVIAAEGYLEEIEKPEKFVVNLSTSLAIEKLALKKGSSVERSAVGEINVVNKMNELGSNLGGEGNGGVILRESHLGRDSLVGATMVLNRMSQGNQKLSQIFNSLPQYQIVKDKIKLEGINSDELIVKVSKKFKNAQKNTIDGIKFIWDDRWVHLRKSNTEPIMRIYAEAPDKIQAEELVKEVKSLI